MDGGFTLWFTGLSGAGKTTLAELIVAEVLRRGRRVELLDGDTVRTHLSKGPGFSREDRDTNILRIGWVCQILTRNGVVAVASAISPYRETRQQVREMIGVGQFVEVYVATPLDECVRRDPKALYRRAIEGTIQAFTGISDPYEPPLRPEIVVTTMGQTPDESALRVLSWLEEYGYITAHAVSTIAPQASPA